MAGKRSTQERVSTPGPAYEHPRLSTTAYALLGLLALREWTNYELAEQMRRGVGDLWSAARSMVFAEPKRLVAQDLASVRHEMVGRRPRAVYAITPAGRSALRSWLHTPGAPPALQFEGILKVLLADSGDVGACRASVEAARTWACELQDVGREVAREYLDGSGPFQDRSLQVSLTFDFLWRLTTTVMEWADRTEAQISKSAAQRSRGDIEATFRHALDDAGMGAPSRP